jgi:hypothetical protein
VDVGEIASTAPGDQNLFAQSLGVFEHRNPPATFTSFDGAHQSCGATAKNQGVIFMG